MKKRIVLMAVAALLMGGMAMAQDRSHGGRDGDPKVRAERMTERMVKEYSLNEEQKQKLLEINMKLAEKTSSRMSEEERAKRDEQNSERRKEREAARAEYEAQLKNIMTPEQYAAYTKKMQEQKGKQSDKAGGKKSDKKSDK